MAMCCCRLGGSYQKHGNAYFKAEYTLFNASALTPALSLLSTQWPKPVSPNTVFPVEHIIDYVRVSQQQGAVVTGASWGPRERER